MKTVNNLLATLFGIALMSATALGQVVDSFSDGDFTSNPAWGIIEETGSWQIVTNSDVAAGAASSNTLRLNHGIAVADTQSLSTQKTGSWGTNQSWGFWLGRRNQAATAANQSIVWLWANESHLESATVDGYRIQFGDDSVNDEIRLQRVDDGVATNILTSTGAVTNALTDIGFMVRVTRTTASVWTLFTSTLPTANSTGAIATDIPSAANTAVNQGSVTDNTYGAGTGANPIFDNGFFGFMAVHSSAANPRTGAEFDQLYFDTDSDSSLPVTLSAFTAILADSGIMLKWRTESEVNNMGFNLYRSESQDGPFLKIGWMDGAGSSAIPHAYHFIDKTAQPGRTYFYYIEDVDVEGMREKSQMIKIAFPEKQRVLIPSRTALFQNYPNPFNPETWLPYQLAETVPVTIQIYDPKGKIIRTLQIERQPAGSYMTRDTAAYWDGTDHTGQAVGSGIYFYQLTAGDFSAIRKMVILK